MNTDQSLVPENGSFFDLLKSPAMNIMYRVTALLAINNSLEPMSEVYLERGSLPEPSDIAAHIGNFREGGIATLTFGAMIGIVTLPQKVSERPRDDNEIVKRARIAAAGGFLASAVVQVMGEKYGLTTGLAENTPDMLDAAYGIGWSGFIAAFSYRAGLKFMRKNGILAAKRDS